MTLYILDIQITIEYEFDERETHFFLTPEDRDSYRESYLKGHTREDGKYIPNINSIDFYEREHDFEDVKDEMTIEQFEELFNVRLIEESDDEAIRFKVDR